MGGGGVYISRNEGALNSNLGSLLGYYASWHS